MYLFGSESHNPSQTDCTPSCVLRRKWMDLEKKKKRSIKKRCMVKQLFGDVIWLVLCIAPIKVDAMGIESRVSERVTNVMTERSKRIVNVDKQFTCESWLHPASSSHRNGIKPRNYVVSGCDSDALSYVIGIFFFLPRTSSYDLQKCAFWWLWRASALTKASPYVI